MRRTRILPLLLAILMILALFAGCSAPSDYDNMAEPPEVGSNGIYDSNSGTENAEIIGRKLIRTINIEAETKDLDALLTDLDAQLATLGGYVQSKQVRGSATSGNRRYASLTLRIPADKLDQFVNHVSGATNILSNSETTEDVTLKFIATESRIAALEAEEARVMELIGKAENLNELLTLESKLSAIRQELEEVKSQLKLYENLIDYGTVYLSISEEKEYTVVEEDLYRLCEESEGCGQNHYGAVRLLRGGIPLPGYPGSRRGDRGGLPEYFQEEGTEKAAGTAESINNEAGYAAAYPAFQLQKRVTCSLSYSWMVAVARQRLSLPPGGSCQKMPKGIF